MSFLEFSDGSLALVSRSTGNVDGGIVLVEDLGELPADTCIAACDDEYLMDICQCESYNAISGCTDLAGLIWEILLCKGRFRDAEGLSPEV